ncbi:MAG: restriction endonuclease subunit S [Methanospirillum sp.]
MTWRRYPAYRDSGVAWLGEVPAEWQIRQLKYISSMKSGEGITSDMLDEDGETPVYGGNGLRGYTFGSTHDGDYILVGRQGALCGNVHCVHGRFWASEHAIVVSTNAGICVPWLAFTLRAMDLNQYSFTAAQPGLAVDFIKTIRVAVPSEADQHTIAAFLDRETARIDALLAKKERLIALLQEKRAALIGHAVTKGLDPSAPMKDSGIAWLGDVPAHWETLKLTRVASLHSGHTPSRLHPEYWKTCTIPWISLGDVWQLRSGKMEYIEETKEKISELGLRNSAAELLPPGTVILSRTASVGFSGIMATSMATTQDYANWVCGPRILPEYLLQVLRCMKQEFERLMMGSTHQTIYMPDIEAFRIPLPPIKEQQEIVQKVRSLQQRSERLEDAIAESIRLAQEYRTALISAAVTGKIDVRGEVLA